MPASLPVPSKGALRALRNLALGTSCTVAVSAGLLTEDRRRRINTAREVHNNAKKLKSSRQYHNAGGATIESFEEQALKYRDNAFWLPSNVLQDTQAALSRGQRGIDRFGQNASAQEHVMAPSTDPSRRGLSGRVPIIKNLSGLMRSRSTPRRSSVAEKLSKRGLEPSGKHCKILLDSAKVLTEDGSNCVEATMSFLEFFESRPGIEDLALDQNELALDQEIIDTAIKLHGVCRRSNQTQLSDQLFNVILAHGPITEGQFYSFNPEDIISRLINRSEDAMLDPGILTKASSIYLTRNKDQSKAMPESMLSLGSRLCQEAAHLQIDDLVRRLFFRMEPFRGGRPIRDVHHLIDSARRKSLHTKVYRYFLKYYIQTSPDQVQFDHICKAAIDSTLQLQRMDLAEQVMEAATRMAQERNLLVPSTSMLDMLALDWKVHHDIGKTRALFDRLVILLPNVKGPQGLYDRIIQYCIEARHEDSAHHYYNQLCQSFEQIEVHGQIHASFAVSKALRKDWTGVVEEFSKAHQASPNDVEMLSARFVPILRQYTKFHSLTETEHFISAFAADFGLKISLQLMNFMVEVYARAKEVDCISRWIDCAVADGCAVNAETIVILLKNCHDVWDLSFEQIYQLFSMIPKKCGSPTNLINSNTVALLRRMALAATRTPAEFINRLERFDEHSNDSDGIYRSMATTFAKKDFDATLRIYRSAQARFDTEYRHLYIAVKASLFIHNDNFDEAAQFIKKAQDRDIKINSVLVTVFKYQVSKLYEDRVPAERVIDLCSNTIRSLQDAGLVIPLSVVTHASSCLQRRGYNTEAIDLWNSMSSRVNIAPSSFDLAALNSLLMAYIGLQDPTGVRWTVHMIAANKLRPDRKFKLALNNARRMTTRLLEIQPCSNQVHDFLNSLLEGLDKIRPMRKDAWEEQKLVTAKTIKIIESAINDQKAKETEQKGSGGKQKNPKKTPATKLDSGYEVEVAVWRSSIPDENDMINDVDIQPSRQVIASPA